MCIFEFRVLVNKFLPFSVLSFSDHHLSGSWIMTEKSVKSLPTEAKKRSQQLVLPANGPAEKSKKKKKKKKRNSTKKSKEDTVQDDAEIDDDEEALVALVAQQPKGRA